MNITLPNYEILNFTQENGREFDVGRPKDHPHALLKTLQQRQSYEAAFEVDPDDATNGEIVAHCNDFQSG